MGTYTTVSGDTFDLIAYKVYGNESFAVHLITANLDHINTVMFSDGVIIRVPPIERVNDFSDLPPWKQGGF